MTTAVESRTGVLRLHLGPEGTVWHGHGVEPGYDTGLVPDDYVRHESFVFEAEQARLLGTRRNASLIVCLQDVRRCGVYVGSPALLRAAAPPAVVLHHLRQPYSAFAGVRPWYELTPNAGITYLLIKLLDAGGHDGQVVRRCLSCHPAWPAISFVRSLESSWAERLLTEIVDPRWYSNARHPGRLSALHAYLGLTPANAGHLLGLCHPGRNYVRAEMAMRAWYNERLDASPEPGNFLRRMLQGPVATPIELLRATRRFVTLLSVTWAAVLSSHPEAGFDTERFFRNRDAEIAFCRHVQTIQCTG